MSGTFRFMSGSFFASILCMKEFSSFVSRFDSLEIHYSVFIPEREPVAVLQILHGMCGCKERFMPFMEFMAEHGIVCFANDHRGHGNSIWNDSDLGYMYDGGYKALIDDVGQMNSIARKRFPDLPLFILGHSMGSLALRTYLKYSTESPSGVILCGSPSYNKAAPMARLLTSALCKAGLDRFRPVLIQSLTSFFYNRNFRPEGSKAWLCSDPIVRNKFLNDPKTNFLFTFNGSDALLNMMYETYSDYHTVSSDYPVLFLSGADDPCMNGIDGLQEAVETMRKAGFAEVAYKLYPAMRHEILNEIGKERVWQDILEFVCS